mmetsp:Transcript_6974/g.42718  ORF Transcript_6974/g.42718 Transcript_6974/m.42718 type:complete len:217 (+) Transcript_6974:974-1624(+)
MVDQPPQSQFRPLPSTATGRLRSCRSTHLAAGTPVVECIQRNVLNDCVSNVVWHTSRSMFPCPFQTWVLRKGRGRCKGKSHRSMQSGEILSMHGGMETLRYTSQGLTATPWQLRLLLPISQQPFQAIPDISVAFGLMLLIADLSAFYVKASKIGPLCLEHMTPWKMHRQFCIPTRWKSQPHSCTLSNYPPLVPVRNPKACFYVKMADSARRQKQLM